MKWLWIAVLVTTGCDHLLQLDPIAPVSMSGDGGVRGDAIGGGVCPPAGSAPQFGGTTALVAPPCLSYTLGGPPWPPATGDLAVAQCNGNVVAFDGGMQVVETGPTGANAPRLTSHGELFGNRLGTIDLYTQTAQADTWHPGVAQVFGGATISVDDVVSAPSGAPQDADRHILLYQSGTIAEYAAAGTDSWMLVASLGAAQLGQTPNGGAWLSSDGLRMAFPSYAGVYYTSRAALGDAFPAAQQVLPAGAKSYGEFPWLTPDCARLYYTDSFDGNVYSVDRVK